MLWSFRHKSYFFYFCLIFASIFYLLFKELFLLILLVLANILVSFFKKYLKQLPLEFELVTLTVILFSRHGWLISMLIGFCMLFSILLIESRFSPYNLVKFIGIAIVAIASSYFGENHLDFSILIIAYNIFLISSYHLLKMNPFHNLAHQASNIAFNLWIYSVFYSFLPSLS